MDEELSDLAEKKVLKAWDKYWDDATVLGLIDDDDRSDETFNLMAKNFKKGFLYIFNEHIKFHERD